MTVLVRYELANEVATLSMDDGKANVMRVAMLTALNEALDRAEREARVVILRGRAGGAFSGGFDLAVFKRGGPEVRLSCDVRIGVDVGARFQVNEVRIGMTVPYVALAICRDRLAKTSLHAATTLGLPFTPAAALTAGFVDELVPSYALDETVRRHCADLLTLNTASFTATKRRLNADFKTALAAAIAADLADWQESGYGR